MYLKILQKLWCLVTFQNRTSAPIRREENFFLSFEFLEGQFCKEKAFLSPLKENWAFFWTFPPHLCLLAELNARAWAEPYSEENLVTYPPMKFWKSRDHTSARPSVRPTTPQENQCKITQSTGMATQMELGIFLAGNRMAQPRLVKQDNRKLCKNEASGA